LQTILYLTYTLYIFTLTFRYKLEYEVEFNKATAKFIFWDRECNELLGKIAADLHAIMVEVCNFTISLITNIYFAILFSSNLIDFVALIGWCH
jgi:hypothetical protein